MHTQLNDLIDGAKTDADKLKGRARTEYDMLIEKTQSAKDRTRELLSNLHEDVAEDKDLLMIYLFVPGGMPLTSASTVMAEGSRVEDSGTTTAPPAVLKAVPTRRLSP